MKTAPKVKRFRPFGKFRGPVIPNVLLRYRKLPASCKLMWARLAQYLGKDGDAFPSYDTLAAEIGVSRRQAIYIVQRLQQGGFLHLEQRPGRTCLFHLLHHPCLGGEIVAPLGGEEIGVGRGEVDCTPGVKDLHQGGEVDCTRRESPKRIKEENHTTTSEPNPTLSTSDDGGGGVLFSANAKKPQPHLTPEQQAYLELSVTYQEAHGGFQKSKAAFTRWLRRELVNGRRDMSDMEELSAWKDRIEGGPHYRNFDEIEREAQAQREETERQRQEHLEAVRAKLLPALTGAPQEHIHYIFDNSYGDMQLWDVQTVLSQEYPEIISKLKQERLDAAERDARERLGLSPREPKPVKTKEEQIIGLFLMYFREGNRGKDVQALNEKYPDEFNAALRILQSEQSDDMTF